MPVPSGDPTETASAHAHDDPLFRTGRVHIAARQRGADVTALVGLVLHVPHILAGLAVVFAVAYAVDVLGGPPWSIPLAAWALSGVLVFHRPCERLMARRLFGLRHPTPQEAVTLRAVWRAVTARAGVHGGAYQLWVEESHDINAMATAGHIVGVTSHALRTLPPAQLAGVLAHELGHHTRGHTWASLLSFWYALPGRLAWRLLLRLARRVQHLSVGATTLVVALLGAALVALTTATYGLILLPLATPYLAAAVSRRAELRADEHAAGLGFAAQLMVVLGQEHERTSRQDAARAMHGAPAEKVSIIARLLDGHPDVHTRLHHLQNWLESRH
ncbi:M48 family metalloprotease [Streptomyces olivaceoviridis]|uniref:M48 family metalloprotease n=1 Tax=Streptomyces olivaceoviridis TaxID=1921 RepID=UPI0033BD2BDC